MLRPSRQSLQAAWTLGRQMAVYERRLRPELISAHTYGTYARFQMAHRHRIEQDLLFAPWDVKLHRLVEQAARGCRLSLRDAEQWDRFYSSVARAIHSVFWQAWEQAYQLEQHYCKYMAAQESPDAPAAVLRVANPPKAGEAVQQSGEPGDLWDNVADKLFDQMKSDEDAAFWSLPTADSQGSKSGR
jgi:hypothetical protein